MWADTELLHVGDGAQSNFAMESENSIGFTRCTSPQNRVPARPEIARDFVKYAQETCVVNGEKVYRKSWYRKQISSTSLVYKAQPLQLLTE